MIQIHTFGDPYPKSIDSLATLRQSSPGCGGRNITVAQLDALLRDDDCWEMICDMLAEMP